MSSAHWWNDLLNLSKGMSSTHSTADTTPTLIKMPSSGAVLVHIAGLVAVSQLLLSTTQYHQELYQSLNKNATSYLHDALDRIADSLSVFPFFVGGVELAVGPGTVLLIFLYLAAALYAFYLARKAFNFFFGRIENFRPVADIGFEYPEAHISKGLLSKKEVLNEVRRRKRVGELPPVYPNGWFCLLRSEELAVGGSTSVNALGQNFALFRDKEGEVHILDAYCAHLGANLAVGGKVTGKCIECPFHGWRYSGETGHCVHIPYSKSKVPSQAKVKVWPSLEVNGLICVWYDAEGRDPGWFPEVFEKIKSKRWIYHGVSTHFINAHIEDIPENGGDIAHLNYVHSAGVPSGAETDYKDRSILNTILSHVWTGTWEALPEPKGHVGRLTLSMSNRFFGFKVPGLNFHVTADQHGPGLVFLSFKSILGSGLFIQTLTPQEPLLQRYDLIVYADWWIPSLITGSMAKGYDTQLERDMILWNNKSYNLKPVLVREDDLILKHRRWFSQFYSEHSPRFTFKKEDDITF